MQLFNVELENKVIKTLIDKNQLIPQANLVADDLFDDNNKLAYQTILDTYEKTGFIDFDILKSKLTDKVPDEYLDDIKNIESKGGLHYANTVKEYSNKRKIQLLSAEIEEMLEKNDPNVLDTFTNKCSEITNSFGHIEKPLNAIEITDKFKEHYDKLKDSDNKIFFKSHWYPTLDNIICWRRKKLYTIAARTSIGKSAFGTTLSLGFAYKKSRVLYFSLEMDHIELCERILSFYSHIDNYKFRNGNVDKNKLVESMKEFKKRNDFFNLQTSRSVNVNDITRIATDMKYKNGLDILVIDYLGIIQSHMKQKQVNKHIMISEILEKLRALSEKLDCAVIILSQITRGGNESDMPNLSQLKESGSIENDSDSVIFLHRPDRDSRDAILKIGKNRGGVSGGEIPMIFEPKITRYMEKTIHDKARAIKNNTNNQIPNQYQNDNGDIDF